MGQGNKEKYYGIITLNTKKESEDLTTPGICWDPDVKTYLQCSAIFRVWHKWSVAL